MYERNFSRSYRSILEKGMKRGLRWNTNIRIFVLIALVFSLGIGQMWLSNATSAEVAPTADLTICKFNDVNKNGTQDEGDTPLQWPFTVVMPGDYGILSTGTNAESGCVTIAGLPLGDYTVTEDNDNNTSDTTFWTKSNPVSGVQTITLAPGENNTTFLNYVAVCTDNDDDGYYHEGGACGVVDCNDNNPLSWHIDSYWYDGDSDGYHVNASNSGPDGKIAICYGASIPTGYMETTLGEDCNDNDPQYNVSCAPPTGTIQVCKYEQVGGQCTPETPNADFAVYKNGYYWAWASPCDGGCSIADPNRVPEWRYATEEEWALRPAQSDFLDGNGNVICAASYFDDTHRHCDYGNPEVRTPQGGWYESWYIYDCTYEPQQVRAEQNKILVAFANLWNKFIAKAALAGVLPGTPLANWTIHLAGLDSDYSSSQVTGENGCTEFTVPYGTYRITEQVKDYWEQVNPGGDGYIDVTVNSSTPSVWKYFLNRYTDPIFGCMDQEALNYDESATASDGSCEYAKRGGGSEISIIQSTPPAENTPEQPVETPPEEIIPEPEVQVLGFETEAPVEEVPVQVLGYESLPETGGPAGVDVTWLGTLLMMSGVFIAQKYKK